MYPDCQTRELHREAVEINAVNTAPGDHAPQQLTVLYCRAFIKLSQFAQGNRAKFLKFPANTRQIPFREKIRHALLDPIDGPDQEMA